MKKSYPKSARIYPKLIHQHNKTRTLTSTLILKESVAKVKSFHNWVIESLALNKVVNFLREIQVKSTIFGISLSHL
jgi:hypothetical protein